LDKKQENFNKIYTAPYTDKYGVLHGHCLFVAIALFGTQYGVDAPAETNPDPLGLNAKGKDRRYTGYLGVSEECHYSAYQKAVSNIMPTELNKLGLFVSGHQAERSLRGGLIGFGYNEMTKESDYKENSVNYIHQMELSANHKGMHIKGHSDFTFIDKKRKLISIKETKYTGNLPHQEKDFWTIAKEIAIDKNIKIDESMNDAQLVKWIQGNGGTIANPSFMGQIKQVLRQMWLAKKQYPDYEVKGSVVHIARDFSCSRDYAVEYNEELLNIALEEKLELWNSIQNKEEPKNVTIKGYCHMCEYRDECPTMKKSQMVLPGDIEEQVANQYNFRVANKKTNDSKKGTDENIKALLKATGVNNAEGEMFNVQYVDVKGGEYIAASEVKIRDNNLYKELTEKNLVKRVKSYDYIKVTKKSKNK